MGRYSSLEITWVGTGRWRSSHASRSDLRIQPLWTWGFEQDGTVFGLDIFTPAQPRILSTKDYCSTTRFTTAMPHLSRMASSSTERWLLSKKIVNAKEGRTRKFRCQADQYSLCSKIRRKSPFVEHPLLKTAG